MNRALAIGVVLGWAALTASADEPATEKVTLGTKPFKLELALDRETRRKGLSGRKKIAADGGMLFVFPKAKEMYTVMAYCETDIDVVFVNASGRIVATYEMKVEPKRKKTETDKAYRKRLKRYKSRVAAQFVIELRAGSIKALKLKRGGTISLDRKGLVKRAK